MRQAFAAKDASFDGLFVVAVKTTGIFCRPVCRARTPRAENIEFFPNSAEAERAGYRPCKLCRPVGPVGEAPADVQRLVDLIDGSDNRLKEVDLKAAGFDPRTARRRFKLHFGMTFTAYQRARRMGSALQGLKEEEGGDKVLAAQLEAGFASGSGFRAAFERLFGVVPSAGSAVEVLTAGMIPTPIGPMLAIAIDEGLLLCDFTDRRGLEKAITRLRTRRRAVIVPGSHPVLDRVKLELDQYFAGKRLDFTLPLLPMGSEFERRAWSYLLEIPPGETRTYGQQAKALGNPGAARAVGRANGMNYLSILIPCHRVVGEKGMLTGYGGGLHRKRWLLEHEQKSRGTLSSHA